MKALLVGECREGKLLGSTYELLGFAKQIGAQAAVFLVGDENIAPGFDGKLYLADAGSHGEFNPEIHKKLLLEAIEREQPELIVLSHSSYGWDLAPRIAVALQAGQITEVMEVVDGSFVVPACNAKLRRQVRASTPRIVVTVQAGAFVPKDPEGAPQVEKIETADSGGVEFLRYEAAELGGVDLSRSEVIVSAGRGIGKTENLAMVEDLAKALGGDYAASRPVVDAGWADHARQVGSTGQTVTPKLYVACGISGAIQHLAGMKKSEFVVAINTDKDAPIGEVADVLIVADLKQFIPAFTARLNGG
jgi:electron transfer flavoprotein alpha subunit